MKNNNFLDQNKMTEGEQLINQQIMESYHSGVIDNEITKKSQSVHDIER